MGNKWGSLNLKNLFTNNKINLSLLNSLTYRFYKSNSYLIKKKYSGKGFIFMLHRILPENQREKFDYNKSLAITPEGLQSFITKFKLLGFEFISVENLLEHLNFKHKKKFICFTLDDGYRDNLTYGLPVFEKNNIPFTIYITNSFPNKTANHWWYHFEDLLKENNLSFLNHSLFKEIKNEKTDQSKKFNEIRDVLLKLSPEDFNNSWTSFFSSKLETQKDYNKSICLNWDEIVHLSNHELCTIGAHTLSHISLKHQSDSVCYKEMLNSKNEIEGKINKKVHHFCYPYGSLNEVGEREINFAKKIGFKTAVLNHPGSIFKKNINYPYQIPRMGLSDETETKRLNDLFSGRLHFNFNGLSKIIKIK